MVINDVVWVKMNMNKQPLVELNRALETWVLQNYVISGFLERSKYIGD